MFDLGSGCAKNADQYYVCSDVTAVRFDLGPGNDTVEFTGTYPGSTRIDVPLTVNAGGGHDEIEGGTAGDVVRGGDGNDEIFTFGGADLIIPGYALDQVVGGDGADTLSYEDRTEPVAAEAGFSADNGSANDESACCGTSRDFIQEIERLKGGAGDDTLRAYTGGPQAASIAGGAGADWIYGGTEADTLIGEAGDDHIEGGGGTDAIDGREGADALYGGADSDGIEGGPGDDWINALGGEDSISAGAGLDVVEARDQETDGINCGGDGDHVHADEIDSVEECDPPAPVVQKETVFVKEPVVEREIVPTPGRVPADLAYTYLAGRRSTTLRDFAIETESGASVAATCRTRRGARCKGVRDFKRAGAATAVRLKGFERKRLPVGARLSIRVTKTGMVGAVKTLTIRKRRSPSLKTLCIPVGAASPSAC
jgi:hypothetical protein